MGSALDFRFRKSRLIGRGEGDLACAFINHSREDGRSVGGDVVRPEFCRQLVAA